MTAATLSELTRSDVLLHTGQDPDETAHYFRKTRIGDAAVSGEPIPALCGYLLIPSRDHVGRPVCQRCKAILDDDVARVERGRFV